MNYFFCKLLLVLLFHDSNVRELTQRRPKLSVQDLVRQLTTT